MAESKQLKVVANPKLFGSFAIAFEGGGQVPEVLSGRYTSIRIADTAIMAYLANDKRGAGKTGGK